jgi:hypothetical protein
VDGMAIGTIFHHLVLSRSSDFLIRPSGRRGPERRQKLVKCLSMKKSDQSLGPFFCRFGHGNPSNLSELFFPGQDFTLNVHSKPAQFGDQSAALLS